VSERRGERADGRGAAELSGGEELDLLQPQFGGDHEVARGGDAGQHGQPDGSAAPHDRLGEPGADDEPGPRRRDPVHLPVTCSTSAPAITSATSPSTSAGDSREAALPARS
jgi:hypothetical protein